MKKIFFLASFCVLIFTSCSSDSSGSNSAILLLKRGTVTSNEGEVIYNGEYIYQDGRIIKRISTYSDSSIYVDRFIYTNALITKIESYKDDALQGTYYYEYDENNKLITSLYLSNVSNFGSRSRDEYNPDGTITVTVYEGDLINQNTVVRNVKVFFENENVSKRERYTLINGQMETITTQYAYDNKKNPLYYIPSYNKLEDYAYGVSRSANNITSITYSATNATSIDVDETQYDYNASDFPTKSAEINPDDNGGPPIITQYFY